MQNFFVLFHQASLACSARGFGGGFGGLVNFLPRPNSPLFS